MFEIEDDDEENIFKSAILFGIAVVLTFWLEAVLELLTIATAITGVVLWPTIAVLLVVLYVLVDRRMGPF